MKKYQKGVDKIVVEENKWKEKGGNPLQLSVYFNPRFFRYCPKHNEIRAMIDGLVEIYGKEKIEAEIGIVIKRK